MNPQAYQEMANTETTHWWFLARRKIIESFLKKLSLKKEARVLEVGCGTGGNLAMLARFGKVSAFEMDEIAMRMAIEQSHGSCDIRRGFCPNAIPFEQDRFDLICMFDVLEHIEEDGQTLQKLKLLLNPGGQILVTVPAYAWLYGAHDEFLHHKRRYTADQLKSLAGRIGLQVKWISYFNSLLFPLVAIARLKDKLFKSATPTGTEVPGKWTNHMLKMIFSSEQYFLNVARLPFGVSLAAVFELPQSSIDQA